MTGSSLPGVGDVFGRYRIDGQIGFGGMGMVLAATDLQLGRKVALKVIAAQLATSDEFRTRFEREATLMTRMDSPHVLTVYDHGVLDGVPWLATPHIAGGDLGGLLRQRGAMPLPMAATVCAQVASALHDAHQVGIVHRDVKPANILLRDPDAAEPFSYLCDFGIAHTGESGLTHTGSVAGSWSYIAPERIKGGPGTPQTDIYALGCVLWACLTGHAPYSGTDIEVAIAHAQAPVPQLTATDPLSQQVNRVLTKALAKDPAERYATAGQFRQDLVALTRGGSLAASAFPPPPPAPDLTASRGATPAAPRKRRTGLIVVGAVVALALLGGAGVGSWALMRGDDDKGGTSGQKPGGETTEAKESVAADLNADGKADLVFGYYNADAIGETPMRIYTVYSSGSRFSTSKYRDDPSGDDMFADWDGDGKGDLIVQRWSTVDGNFRARVVPSDGTAPFVIKPARKRTRDLADGGYFDMNGDGRKDLVLLEPLERENDEGVNIEVGLATDEGFAEPTIWFTDPDMVKDRDFFRFADLDGDGKADLVTLEDSAVVEKDTDGPGGKRYYDELRFMQNQGEALVEVGERVRMDKPAEDRSNQIVLARAADGSYNLLTIVPTEKDGTEGHTLTVRPLSLDGVGEELSSWVEDPDAGITNYRMRDVDGDGDDDLMVVTEPAGEDKIDVSMMLWNGEAFDAAESWYTLSCETKQCEADEFRLLSAY